MITLEEIKKFYPSDIHRFDRGLLREYLQYLILGIIFENKRIGPKLSFLGGTCLRIVYGSKRFSEDLDFDNKGLTEEEFEELAEYIAYELEKRGLKVETKVVNRGAFHCNIKFPRVLQENRLSGYDEEKILIQIDSFDQGVSYETGTYVLSKFDVIKPIVVTPKSVILASKLWTITNRARAKGRDYYDIVFLSQNTVPDKKFLLSKFEADEPNEVREKIASHLTTLDFEKLADDVRPFLMKESDLDSIRYFPTLFEQMDLGG